MEVFDSHGKKVYTFSNNRLVIDKNIDIFATSFKDFADEIEEIYFTENVSHLPIDTIKICSNLKKLDLQKTSALLIPSMFCENLKNLEEVHLSSTTKTIEHSAFYNCENLKYINLDNIILISGQAFANCYNLENINLENLTVLYSAAFASCKNINNINLASIIIIGSIAFSDCTSLKNVKISNNCENIENECFKNCVLLDEISLPQRLKSIGHNAFRNTNIKNFYLPKTIENLRFECFDLKNKPNIFYDGTIEEFRKVEKDNLLREYPNIYYKCPSLDDLLKNFSIKEANEIIKKGYLLPEDFEI